MKLGVFAVLFTGKIREFFDVVFSERAKRVKSTIARCKNLVMCLKGVCLFAGFKGISAGLRETNFLSQHVFY